MIKEKDLTLEELKHFQDYLDYKYKEIENMKECEYCDRVSALCNMLDAIKGIKLDLMLEVKRRRMIR